MSGTIITDDGTKIYNGSIGDNIKFYTPQKIYRWLFNTARVSENGRLAIPQEYLDAFGREFVLGLSLTKHWSAVSEMRIVLYPEKHLSEVTATLAERVSNSWNNPEMKRKALAEDKKFHENLTVVSVDENREILIPARFRDNDYSAINGKVILKCDKGGALEIWNEGVHALYKEFEVGTTSPNGNLTIVK